MMQINNKHLKLTPDQLDLLENLMSAESKTNLRARIKELEADLEESAKELEDFAALEMDVIECRSAIRDQEEEITRLKALLQEHNIEVL